MTGRKGDVRSRCGLGTFVLFLAASGVAPVLRGAKTKSPLESIERRIQTAYENVAPAIVWIAVGKDDERPYSSGVIVTSDGYVLTVTDLLPGCIRGGESVALYLSSGRRVTGKVLGWSVRWKICLIKIAEPGPWPYVKLAEKPLLKPGELCLEIGYPSPPDFKVDPRPILRSSWITRSALPTWFTCREMGPHAITGTFDVDGRLVGVMAFQPMGVDPVYTGVEAVKANWDALVAGQDLDRLSVVPSQNAADGSSGSARPESRVKADEKRVSASIEKAKAATVEVRPSGEKKGGSGVIVTTDGYVVTCAHHFRLPGEKVAILLPDGRETKGVFLGSNWLSDICLVKITEKGPWPHVEMGDSTRMKPNDPCLVIGYPGYRDEREPPVRRSHITEPQGYPSSYLLFTSRSCQLYGGDSGGGLFDLEGRVMGVHLRIGINVEGLGEFPNGHGRIECFKKDWGLLASGKGLDAISTEPLGEIREAFGFVAKELAGIVVEVLGDGKPRGLGTIVAADGRVLTKASKLDGAISCRMADGRTLPATVQKVSREHDIAVLKVEAGNLRAADWSSYEKPSVGTLIAALTPGKPPLAGIVSHGHRPIRPERGYFPVTARDSARGLEVADDSHARLSDCPLRKGDIVVQVEGHPTPDFKTLKELLFPDAGNPVACAGDPILVRLKRGKEALELRFTLGPTRRIVGSDGRIIWPENQSRRWSGFPSVFDTDIPLTPTLCGAPVIDKNGRLCGIAIACRARGQTHVLPATVIREFVAK